MKWQRGGMKTCKGLVTSENNHSHTDFLHRWYDMQIYGTIYITIYRITGSLENDIIPRHL